MNQNISLAKGSLKWATAAIAKWPIAKGKKWENHTVVLDINIWALTTFAC